MTAPKLTPPQPSGNDGLDRWLNLLWRKLTSAGEILWTQVSKVGSNLTDIETRNHADLQNLNTASYTHLTATNHTDLTDGGLTDLHRHTADDVVLPALQTPTRDDVTDWFNAYSSGQITGGVISATGTQISVTAGEGTIKSGATSDDPTYWCKWSALSLTTITDARVTWVCVDYNAGNPAIVLLETTTNVEPAALNYNSCWPLGYCVREGATVHVTNNPRKVQDAVGGLIRRFHQTLPLSRDELVGGLIVGETGTRNITLSAGYLFDRQNRFTIAALNTSVSGSFDRYYRDAGSGFTKESAQTAWPNTQYDDGSGTLVTMTNNKYSNLFWYLELDGNLVMMYGRNQYNTAAEAADEGVPATLPLRVLTDGRLIARTTFQKSAATFTAIDSAFDNIFASSALSTHNNLSGLQGGTTGEYYHLTAAQYAALGSGSGVVNNVISTPTTIATDTSYTVVSYLTVDSTLTINGNLAII